MKGDFTRDRFDPAKGYNRVLKQQGRVELDSDWNEQAAIQQHMLRTLIVDLLGPAAGPVDNCGFGLADPAETRIEPVSGDFQITAGRYYVDGLLLQTASPFTYAGQPWVGNDSKLEDGTSYLAYLDVWERHVNWLDDPAILEPALGGPDTCTRVQTVWCVRTMPVQDIGSVTNEKAPAAEEAAAAPTDAKITAIRRRIEEMTKAIDSAPKGTDLTALRAERTELNAALRRAGVAAKAGAAPTSPTIAERGPSDHAACNALLQPLREARSGAMAARVRPQEPSDNPCVLPPESRYRGLENQLYRIEIHAGGDVGDANAAPSFKWSRDNGAVATLLLDAEGKTITVASTRGFDSQCSVEILSEAQDAQGQGGFIAKVTAIDGDVVALSAELPFPFDAAAKLRVRRWDALPAEIQPDVWTAIEDGIEVRFAKHSYHSGDYWLVPARVATGGIDWPQGADNTPTPCWPSGVVHHYAPLFIVTATDAKPFVKLVEDCRCHIARIPCAK